MQNKMNPVNAFPAEAAEMGHRGCVRSSWEDVPGFISSSFDQDSLWPILRTRRRIVRVLAGSGREGRSARSCTLQRSRRIDYDV